MTIFATCPLKPRATEADWRSQLSNVEHTALWMTAALRGACLVAGAADAAVDDHVAGAANPGGGAGDMDD